jgi:pimeloyl-ACP methyl ester carboxylesterase
MKKLLLMLSLLGMFLAGTATVAHCKTVVLFIGGWRMTQEQMAAFSRSVSESDKVEYLLPDEVSELIRPWYCADLLFTHIRDNELLHDDLILVSFSHGGIVSQWLLNAHPELRVKKLILVGAPIGGYKFVPPNNFFSNKFPKDLPIYVIAGNKGQDAWFLRAENDGVVDLDSALDIPAQHLKDAAVYFADHSELKTLPEVQARIAMWLGIGPESPDLKAEMNPPSRPMVYSRRFSGSSHQYPN